MSESAVNNLKEVTEEALKNVKDGEENVSDIQGKSSKGVEFIGRSGKSFYIKPCGIDGIPELVKQVKIIDEKLNSTGSPIELMVADDNAVLKSMGKVIALGLGKDVDDVDVIKSCMSEFSLGTFPKVYTTVLDLNDFLAGMKSLYQ